MPPSAVFEAFEPGPNMAAEFQAMRGWYEFTDHIDARTEVFFAVD